MSNQERGSRRTLLRAGFAFLLYVFLVPAILFISAGTLDWPMAWVYAILLLGSTFGSRLLVFRRNPALLRERASFTEAEGTPAWDRVLMPIVGIYGPVAMMVVAGLDYRFNQGSGIPASGQLIAALIVAAGYGLAVWAMVVNPFFSSVVRIQTERGQYAVAAGPYRFVRHPSYAGAILAWLALPFMLDTLWALIPGLALIAAMVIRTRLEDQMLLQELDGYPVLAAQTRYRLFPGIW